MLIASTNEYRNYKYNINTGFYQIVSANTNWTYKCYSDIKYYQIESTNTNQKKEVQIQLNFISKYKYK